MMKTQQIIKALRRLIVIKVAMYGDQQAQDDGATLAAVRVGIKTLLDVLELGPGIPADTFAARETGPENSREEVVGTSTRGKNANTGNSGFSGGRPLAAQGLI